MSFQRKVGLIATVVQASQLNKSLLVVVQLREGDRIGDLLKEQGLPLDSEQGRCVDPAQMRGCALVKWRSTDDAPLFLIQGLPSSSWILTEAPPIFASSCCVILYPISYEWPVA